MKGKYLYGGDEVDLCGHAFKALETLVSVYLELITVTENMYQNLVQVGQLQEKR